VALRLASRFSCSRAGGGSLRGWGRRRRQTGRFLVFVDKSAPYFSTLVAQMAFQFREFHASAISKTSRTACGERPFSASSRWHCSTSFSASARFALAPSMVSPWESRQESPPQSRYSPPLWRVHKRLSISCLEIITAPPVAGQSLRVCLPAAGRVPQV